MAKPSSKKARGKQKASDINPIDLCEEDLSDDDLIVDDMILIDNQSPVVLLDKRRGSVEDIEEFEMPKPDTRRTDDMDRDPSDLYRQMCDLRTQVGYPVIANGVCSLD